METLKVSTKSNPNSVAGAIAGIVRESGSVEVFVVGAGTLNQCAKAIAIALTRPENALVFGGYTAVALVVGTVLLYRRDTN